MPLLKKKAFRRTTLVGGFRDNDDVFHCPITNEIFRDYDEFCARVILCNSMVWTCSYTGKCGLTYSEALDSEKHAKRLLKDFPTELRIPVLYLASKTRRSSTAEMFEDIYGFVKDRYFIGENVEASFTGNKWHDAHILQVIAPSSEKIDTLPKNGKAMDRSYGVPSMLYHYEVEQLDSEDQDICEVMVVGFDHIRRKKKLSRDKLKLFLKQYIEQNELGVFIIKPSVLDKHGIHKMRFDQIFDGTIPNFNVSRRLTNKTTKQATLVPFLKKKSDIVSKKKEPTANGLSENPNNLLEKMRKRQEDFIQKKEDVKRKRAEYRRKQRQENLEISQMLKEWNRPRDDLELDDHMILPVPATVCTKIPDEYMGDVFTILEFAKTFSKFLSVNNFFPGGLTLELVERAILEKEVAGPLLDLIQMFLSALFGVQLEEASQYNTKLDSHSDIKGRDYNDNVSLTEASHFATLASTWSTTYQGYPLNRLPLYSLTTSEILRLHLLSSGARINDTGARWRYQYRGGYTSEDDPGLYFRLKYPHILKALSLHSITELPMGDIFKIIDCLMSQLLTYADIRDLIEDQYDKSKQAKLDLRAIQAAERKYENEFITAKWKIKKEAKENNYDPTEKLEKLTKDLEKKKAENEKKSFSYIKIFNKHQVYLGQDRAFRKYFKLESIPGVFVNYEEDNPGYCYNECIQQNPAIVGAGRDEIIAHLRKIHEETNTSDKENALDTQAQSNSIANGEINLSNPIITPDQLLICNSNPKSCAVHSSSAIRDKWLFFNHSEQITTLSNSLNVRGIHEGELKQSVASAENYLTQLIDDTPVTILNPKLEVSEEDTERKSRNNKTKSKPKYEDATLGYPKDLSPSLMLQYALVENILEIEEKIFAGNLGSIKIKNRDVWRQHLANHHYKLLERSKRNKNNKLTNKIKDEGKNSRSSTPDLAKEYQDPGRFLGLRDDIESTEDQDLTSNNTILCQSEDDKLAIHCLAYALAQVAEGVDSRYLKKPLGNVSMRSDDNKISSDILDKWENSLLASTSYCQIFVHYSSLDNCILWSRSALLARCKVCRKQRDSENMLLCDNCNKGQHLYCQKPKLTSVPKGDWFCSDCRKQKEAEEKLKNPKEKPQRRRRIFVEEEDLSEQSDSNANGKSPYTRTRKKRKLSSDADSSEQSDIVNGRTRNRGKGKKKPVPIIEEEESSEASEGSDENNEEEEDEVSEQSENTEEEEDEEQEDAEDEESQEEEDEDENSEIEETQIDEQEDEEMEEEQQTPNGIAKKTKNEVVSGGNDTINGDGQVVEVCEKCGIGGTLLCCDNCPELYHLECAHPPLRRVPRGEWFCHKCKSSKKKEEPDDDWYLSHSVAQRSGVLHNQRRCATSARSNKYGFAKILRRISKYEDNSRRSIRRDDLPLNNAQLQEVLTEVMKQEFAWPFLRPVNKHEVPDYYDIVVTPMDFGTIKYKLNMGRYRFDAELMSDVSLVFQNCKLYNNTTDEVYQCGFKLLKHFVEKSKDVGLHVPHELESNEVLIDDRSSVKSDLEDDNGSTKLEVEEDHSDVEDDHSGVEDNHSDVEKDHSDVENNHSDVESNHSDIESNRSDVENNHSDVENVHSDVENGRLESEEDPLGVEDNHLEVEDASLEVQDNHLEVEDQPLEDDVDHTSTTSELEDDQASTNSHADEDHSDMKSVAEGENHDCNSKTVEAMQVD